MSWSSTFLDALEAGGPQVWRVRTVQVLSEGTYGGVYVATSGLPEGDEDPVLAGPPSIQASTLNVDTWSATIGGLSFELSGDLRTLKQYLTRGSYVEVTLQMGGAVERVAIGRVQQLSYNRGRATLSIADALCLLDGRAVADGESVGLFYELYETPLNTALTSAYTVGDGTLTVASTTNFRRETGGTGCVRLGEFYLTYTGTTSTTFTGLPALGAFWSDAADTGSGQVYDVVLLEGHPLDIAMKVLVSTGLAVHGDYDTLPASWGYGLTSSFLDVADIETERDEVMTVTTGDYAISVVVTEMKDDPKGWLLGILAAFGVFPAMRQGSLTFRAFAALDGRARAAVATYTDADIDPAMGVSSEWWSSQQAVEYGLVSITAQDVPLTGAAQDLATLPGAPVKTYDLQAVLYDNVGEVATDVYDRLYRVAQRVGELLTLPLRGLGPWKLAVGDRIVFQSELTGLRFDYTGLGRELWVLQVGPDPRLGRTTVRALSLPPVEPF